MMRFVPVGLYRCKCVGVIGLVPDSSYSLRALRFTHHIHNTDKKTTEVTTDKKNLVNGQESSGKDEDHTDEDINPEWLSLERRVKAHKPRPKGEGVPDGRGRRITTGWDAENV